MEVTFAVGLSAKDLTDVSPKAADGSGSNGAIGGGNEMDQYSLVKKSERTESELSASAGSDSGSSKYIAGLMESYKSEKTFKTKMDSIVGVLAAEVEETDKYTQAVLTRTRARQLVRQIQHDEIMEQSEEQLKETGDDIEESGSASENESGNSDQATENNDSQYAPAPEPEDVSPAETAAVAGEVVDIVI